MELERERGRDTDWERIKASLLAVSALEEGTFLFSRTERWKGDAEVWRTGCSFWGPGIWGICPSILKVCDTGPQAAVGKGLLEGHHLPSIPYNSHHGHLQGNVPSLLWPRRRTGFQSHGRHEEMSLETCLQGWRLVPEMRSKWWQVSR